MLVETVHYRRMGLRLRRIIAKWNGTSMERYGHGCIGIRSIVLLLLQTERVYVGGNFTSMGGVADTAYIAKWDRITRGMPLGTG